MAAGVKATPEPTILVYLSESVEPRRVKLRYRLEERVVEVEGEAPGVYARLFEPTAVILAAPEYVRGCEPLRSSRSYSELLEDVVNFLHERLVAGGLLAGTRVTFSILPWPKVLAGCAYGFSEGLSPLGTAASVLVRDIYEKLVDYAVESPRVKLVLIHDAGVDPQLFEAVRHASVNAARLAAVTSGSTIDVEVYGVVSLGDTLEAYRVAVDTLDPVHSAWSLALRIVRLAGEAGVRLRVAETPSRYAALAAGLNSEARSLVSEDGVAAAVAVLYSMPLFAAYLAAESRLDVDEAMSLLSDAIDYMRGYTFILGGDKLEHLVGLDYSGVYTLLAAAALMRRVKASYAASLGGEACSMEELDDRGVYLDELAELAARLSPLNAGVASYTISGLARSLQEACKCQRDGASPACTSEPPVPLFCGDWPGEKCGAEPGLDEFVATAGLVPQTIEATMDVSGVALRYRDGCWDVVKNVAKRLAARLG